MLREYMASSGTGSQDAHGAICSGWPAAGQAGRFGLRKVSRLARVSSFFPHFGEEAELRGWIRGP